MFGRLTNEPQGSACLYLLVLGLKASTIALTVVHGRWGLNSGPQACGRNFCD